MPLWPRPQPYVRYASEAKKEKKREAAACTFIASSTEPTLCHEVSQNLTFPQLAILYPLYTQVSLALMANLVMISKEITQVFA